MHALIDRQVNKGYVSPTELAVLSKMGKACNELHAANELLLKENRDFKRGLEQRECQRIAYLGQGCLNIGLNVGQWRALLHTCWDRKQA